MALQFLKGAKMYNRLIKILLIKWAVIFGLRALSRHALKDR